MATPSLLRLNAELGVDDLHCMVLLPGLRALAQASSLFGRVQCGSVHRAADVLALIPRLRRERYQSALCLFPVPQRRLDVLLAIGGIRNRLSFVYPDTHMPPARGTRRIPIVPGLHDTDQNWYLVESFLGSVATGDRSLSLPQWPCRPNTVPGSGTAYYVCHPGSSTENGMAAKRLPARVYADLAWRIQREHGLKCAVVGGPEELALRQEVVRASRGAAYDPEPRTLDEAAASYFAGRDGGARFCSAAAVPACIRANAVELRSGFSAPPLGVPVLVALNLLYYDAARYRCIRVSHHGAPKSGITTSVREMTGRWAGPTCAAAAVRGSVRSQGSGARLQGRNGPVQANLNALLVGMGWFPDQPGGLNRYFFDEIQALPSVGVTGAAVVSHLSGAPSLPFALHAMAGRGAPLLRRLAGARSGVRRLLTDGVDLVDSHFALYALPWVCAVPPGVPLVVHFQGPWADEIAVDAAGIAGATRVRIARRIERAVYSRADRIITLSHAFRTVVCERYGVPDDRVTVIPGGVNTCAHTAAPPRNEARARLGWPQDRPILIAVRRLVSRMGLEDLIDAVAELRRGHPRVLLVIGGKGPLHAALQARASRHGLEQNVKFLGFIPEADLPLAYAAADIAVVPSTALEGFGLITVEALAAGTPVMGTCVGGTPEILEGLSRALLFDAAAPAAIASKIDSALSGQLALPDRAACRAHAQQYAWTEVAPRLRKVFDDVRGGCQPAGR